MAEIAPPSVVRVHGTGEPSVAVVGTLSAWRELVSHPEFPHTDGVGSILDEIRVAAGLPASRPDGIRSPHLGARELRAMTLYAGGHSVRAVAIEMGTTEETVKSYLKRARGKFRATGIDLGNRMLLREYALRAGWLDPMAVD
ncbi:MULTISPECIES: sigma factor-like helix-turn-helix DNA-binding protein [unclassified Diaminobutyricimonas]|uniref:sigma factor-like helix-turn-helix DNA-binding protein n=1 Tax=unclassified Diaminobutyricimonas TaxID=2643261 RepID=UPI0012F49712|nr:MULTISPECIES: sigma factor-like helix-turn-helix DNA-binding protein [unclassified Diaminobutyricimonas]